MAKLFIRIEETSERIDEFAIGYLINPTLHINKAFREQVEKCMNNTFVSLTQHFILKTHIKNTSVLALLMLHETRERNPKKYFRF